MVAVRTTRYADPVPNVDPTILSLLAEIDEEADLSSLIGVDLSPPAPSASHAPLTYLPLDEWLRRSEEVHRYLRAARRTEWEGCHP